MALNASGSVHDTIARGSYPSEVLCEWDDHGLIRPRSWVLHINAAFIDSPRWDTVPVGDLAHRLFRMVWLETSQADRSAHLASSAHLDPTIDTDGQNLAESGPAIGSPAFQDLWPRWATGCRYGGLPRRT